MSLTDRKPARHWLHRTLRRLAARWPASSRAALNRRMVACNLQPDPQLTLKVAESREELEACFELLQDPQLPAGGMVSDGPGLRVTAYHALPTTTTLCAMWQHKVIATVTVIRDGVFGLPLQNAVDLEVLRTSRGAVAELACLAIDPVFRGSSGEVLFPLLKFALSYCTQMTDIRHLVAAVPSSHVDLVEGVLCFDPIRESGHFDHVLMPHGAVLAATLDLHAAPSVLRRIYRGLPPGRNLHHYFFELDLPNFKLPKRRYFTKNDPVMTPELLDHFFRQRTRMLATLDPRRVALLATLYQEGDAQNGAASGTEEALAAHPLRRHRRHALRAPAELHLQVDGAERIYVFDVIEVSRSGFQAESKLELPVHATGRARVQLGRHDWSTSEVSIVRCKQSGRRRFYGFELGQPDEAWHRCVAALESSQTARDLVQ